MTLLALEGVGKSYRPGHPVLRGLDLAVRDGEWLGLLGQSGCGKSTLARIALGLERPDTGAVLYRGRPLAGLRGAEARQARRDLQLVFQSAAVSLNPRLTAGASIAEPLRNFEPLDRRGRAARVAELLEMVGLRPEDAGKLPGQFSGGQLQRICIARALAPTPRLIVMDEAVSSLDLVGQARLLDLLAGLRRSLGTACLFITHEIRLARRFCDRVAVMDGGRIVEEGPAAGIESMARHPAARALFDAVLPPLPPGMAAR
ncbi:ATP-binding cassette domain-containing protein [Azospirillum sp. SYSU D00513]|uniref:ATP-binding cassette domain-containing protein n=1 Tax=Azospirillum sp. SYSU D00513 TaxID=2812561 RepID=UPI001A96A3A2|nr:ATP-binding cassette domain-containing protein [Azospirillum sp. SYSU D00513]